MKAEVKPHNGTPTLFLDGQPVFANINWVGGLDPNGLDEVTRDSVRNFAKHNIHIYSTDAMASDWCGPRPGNASPFDFSQVEPRLRAALDVDPDALFLLRIMFETRYLMDNWWNEKYPDEVEVLSNGERWSASYASQVWQTEVQDLLKAYVAHLRAVGLYDRVLAFQICTGTCGEWIKSWSSMNPPSGDFSPAMRRQFQAWLRERYHHDVGALQAAWANPTATFEAAEAPSGEAQSKPSHFLFRDPKRDRQVIDFNECYADITADALLGMCRVVKDATNREKLTGAFFGYLLDLAWNDAYFTDGHGDIETSETSTVQRSGHLGLHKVLRSPDIDFLVSPYSYAFRGLGGDGLPMQPTESLRLHNKLYLFEEDTLMHNNFDPAPTKRMHPVSRNIAIYQRNFAQVVTHGLGITWLENSQFAEDPSIINEAHAWHEHYHKIGTWALGLNRKPAADVAVILDDESFLYEANRNNVSLPLIAHQRVMTLNRFGAPHDLYLLNDLLEGNLPPYKLYIFLNPYHLNDKRRQALKDIVCRDGQTALWYHAPGYLNSDSQTPIHTDGMTDLTGFRFGLGKSYWSAMMHLTDFTHPISRGLPQDLFWGSTRAIAPIFHLEDPEATVLGEVVYGLGRCKPGLAVKTFNAGTSSAWNSVYVAAPSLPAMVLRNIARFAGVHLYNDDGDVLYATPDLLSVHTVSGGERTFQLPQCAEVVYDLFHRKVVGRDAAQFCVQLPPASTALYYTGPAERLQALHNLYSA